jgi:hypothetical protein
MKYLLACLIIPATLILITAVFGFGALYFCVTNLLERMMRLMHKKSSGDADSFIALKIHTG